ncbi:MAG: type IV-A pilus assembly ATPase PilB [Methylococcales bacterium]|nr:type IV-A pilus assembly ATPase PilB [Methylococcales bacterium]MBT3506956.1 type IV-A pilus assembly ATPase PilB [Methylococcales bacterium]MBT3698145.1 type IV-A pilus assembly ATPase PilB [Methylococcales bacterium]MBT3816460.1 type IV-A pilus assembly ATPase PilB [Methylococcales bacterium]MBT4032438.1 type IV-A pilus assembly ATPase PilB [Methylococcales bacterium]
MNSQTAPKITFGLIKSLINKGFIDETDTPELISQAKKEKISVLSYILSRQLVDNYSVAMIAVEEFGLPFLDLDVIDIQQLPLSELTDSLIREHQVLPLFKRNNTLFIALSDPTNSHTLNQIKFHTRQQTEIIIVEDNKLNTTIQLCLDAQETTIADILDENISIIEEEEPLPTQQNQIENSSEIDDAPIVRFVKKILVDAIKKGASDIHVEPYEHFFRIRFRADGILQEIATPPSNMANRMISRIKVMAKMDIAVRRIPQDGRIKIKLSKDKLIDFRVNTCPTLYGEKVVLRILDPSSATLGIEALGFESNQMKSFMNAINQPYGLILITGPTGSGKTVTLYTALNILNSPQLNISTAEDPVEITLPGINQVTMNTKAGVNFSTTLRAFLRQDPDVIMVGEIRDQETAEIAVKAAQTGHLVLSTLHTNDAPQTLNRLIQMGIPPYNIISSIQLIVAQRLVRKLCNHCKQKEKLPNKILLDAGFNQESLKNLTLFTPQGCEHCHNGYLGRIGIYQVMPISDAMQQLILSNCDSNQLETQCQSENILNLRQSALKKVSAGITSLEEINRITRG